MLCSLSCPLNRFGAFNTFPDLPKLRGCFPSATDVVLVPAVQRVLNLISASCATKIYFNWYSECMGFLGYL